MIAVDCDLRVAQRSVAAATRAAVDLPRSEAEHEVNLNPQIPHQHHDGPDPVIQSSFWQRMIGVPSIPTPILSWNGIPFPGVGCNCAPPDNNGEVGKVQYVEMFNEGLQVFDKLTGTSLLGPLRFSSNQ